MAKEVVRFEKTLKEEATQAEIIRALPTHVSPERFMRVLQTSVMQDEKLQRVEPRKVIHEALKIAALGLLTDSFLGEAYLIADYKGDVQSRIGYRGFLKLTRQSSVVDNAYAHEVCENDFIEMSLGTDKVLVHKPKIGNRGAEIAFYAVIKYTNGACDFEIMTIEEINAIRGRSDAWRAFQAKKIKDTPWNSSYGEMAKKTVLRRLLKRAPMSTDLAAAISHDSEHDAEEYTALPMRNITPAVGNDGPPELVELFDAYGEEFMIAPGEVDAWISEQIAEADGDPDKLQSLHDGNPAYAERFLPKEEPKLVHFRLGDSSFAIKESELWDRLMKGATKEPKKIARLIEENWPWFAADNKKPLLDSLMSAIFAVDEESASALEAFILTQQESGDEVVAA
jgi:recombination protein RecT